MGNDAKDHGRFATLKMVHGADGPVLTARTPTTVSPDEFGRLASGAFELIGKLTGHAGCLSGRIRFVVEDPYFSDITRIDLTTGRLG
jgi:hypothetical protein